MATPYAPKPPVSKKVIAGLLVAGLGALLPLVGLYSVPAFAQAAITSAEYAITAYLYKEEEVYLVKALAYLRSHGIQV